MDFAQLVPELLVADIVASRRFYCEILGFDVAYERPENKFLYLDREGAQIMLAQLAEEPGEDWLTGPLQPPFGRGIHLEIGVSALDPMLERLKAAAWQLFRPPEEQWYRKDQGEVGQRQFLVQDPDGYLLRFAEDLGERPARLDYPSQDQP